MDVHDTYRYYFLMFNKIWTFYMCVNPSLLCWDASALQLHIVVSVGIEINMTLSNTSQVGQKYSAAVLGYIQDTVWIGLFYRKNFPSVQYILVTGTICYEQYTTVGYYFSLSHWPHSLRHWPRSLGCWDHGF
jgi:hypothetical protein